MTCCNRWRACFCEARSEDVKNVSRIICFSVELVVAIAAKFVQPAVQQFVVELFAIKLCSVKLVVVIAAKFV